MNAGNPAPATHHNHPSRQPTSLTFVPHPTSLAASPIHAELVAVLAAVTQGTPRVLTTADGQLLPAGPFEVGHRSLQAGLRAWVEEQTHHPLGYMEQLYTFADGDRTDASGARVISVSYLGLTRESADRSAGQAVWQDWYRYFPWEDWRGGEPALHTPLAGQSHYQLLELSPQASAAELRQVATRYPVVLYTGDNCAPCNSGRNLLNARGVPYTEKTVTTNEDAEALKRMAGEASFHAIQEAAALAALAAPMVGGMVSSTVLTLAVIPALYALVKQWELRRGAKPAHAQALARVSNL